MDFPVIGTSAVLASIRAFGPQIVPKCAVLRSQSTSASQTYDFSPFLSSPNLVTDFGSALLFPPYVFSSLFSFFTSPSIPFIVSGACGL